jgi:hypothetical protein
MTEPLTHPEVLAYYRERLPDLQGAGRNRRARCPLHGGKGRNLAVDVETGRWYCHSECLRGGDIFEFEDLLYRGTFLDVKRRVFKLVGRPLNGANTPKVGQPTQFTDEQLSDGEFFRIGLTWRIERALEVLKDYLWHGDGEVLVGEKMAFLTTKLAEMDRWTLQQAAEAMLAADRDLVAECRLEARDAQFRIALGIRSWWREEKTDEAQKCL